MATLNDLKVQAAELGFELVEGTKRGAGYVLTTCEDRTTPLGNDFTASLKEVARFLRSVIDSLKVRARELGFEVVQDDPESGTGYNLIGIEDQTTPLGLDFSSSLCDVREFLDDREAHLGIDERDQGAANVRLAKQTPARTANALVHGHPQAAAIRRLFHEHRNLKQFRDESINDHQFAHDEIARQKRVRYEAEQKLKTNIASRYDPNFDLAELLQNLFMDPTKGCLADIEAAVDHDRSTLPPDPDVPDYIAVQSVKPVTTVKIKRRLSRDEATKRRAELDRRKTIADLGKQLREARARGERGAVLGAILLDAERLIQHGGFLPFLDEIGVKHRTAQYWMAAAKS